MNRETSIYALVDPRDPFVYRYIGKTIKTIRARLQEHVADANRGKRNHRCCWIRKLLSEGVTPYPVLLATVEGDGFSEERAAIAEALALGAPLVNGTKGGEGGPGMSQDALARAKESRAWYRHSPDACAKISNAKKGKPLHPNTLSAVSRKKSADHVAKIAASKRGVALSDEVKRKLSAAQKGAYASGARKVSQKSIDALVASSKGRAGVPLTPEHRAKVGAAGRGKKRSPETRQRLSEAIKAHWAVRRARVTA